MLHSELVPYRTREFRQTQVARLLRVKRVEIRLVAITKHLLQRNTGTIQSNRMAGRCPTTTGLVQTNTDQGQDYQVDLSGSDNSNPCIPKFLFLPAHPPPFRHPVFGLQGLDQNLRSIANFDRSLAGSDKPRNNAKYSRSSHSTRAW